MAITLALALSFRDVIELRQLDTEEQTSRYGDRLVRFVPTGDIHCQTGYTR
jgi:hypothetical protein